MDKVIYMAIFLKDNKILLGLRKYSADTIVWTLPGGKAEKGESIDEAIRREVHEETGLDPEIVDVGNILFKKPAVSKGGKVYYVCCSYQSKINPDTLSLEGDKFIKWNWFSLDSLPSNLIDEKDRSILKNVI